MVQATANYTHAKTCRPKLAYVPEIENLVVENDGTITLLYNQMFNTSGIDNCGEMFALIEIYNESNDELLYNMTMDDAEVS